MASVCALPSLLLSSRPPPRPLSFPPSATPACLDGQLSTVCRRRCYRSSTHLSFGLRLPALDLQRAPQPIMALISPDSGNTLFCLMASCAAFGQVMETKTDWGAKISAPLVALLFGMVLAGAGVVPSTSASYDFVCSSIMPMAVALCLLETDMQTIFTDAGPTLRAFWYGALGTIIGTVVSFKIVGPALGSDGWKIASSLCASYIGGTINYVATAQALGLTSSSTLAAGMAADNLAMAAYFAVIMSIPDTSDKSILGTKEVPTGGERKKDSCIKIHGGQTQPMGPKHNIQISRTFDFGVPVCASKTDGILSDSRTLPTVETISTSLAAAAIACTLGRAVAGLLPSCFSGCGLAITALITSCFSVAAAQVQKHVHSADTQVFAGSQILGAGLMLLYFSVVGASAGLQDALFGGWPLLGFIFVLVSVHLGVILSLGGWSKIPMRMVLVASNANIGGPGTAAAMASCRGWKSLVKPALLVGTLGYTIGTGVGCLVGLHLLRHLL